MDRSSYRAQDYAFGQRILGLRTAIGLTQAGLAAMIGVSRRAIVGWEAGESYPKPHHLQQFIRLCVEHRVFPADRVADEIRDLWHAAHQKVLLDEQWVRDLLRATPAPPPAPGAWAERAAQVTMASAPNTSRTDWDDTAVSWLPQTKLHPPRTRQEVIPRARLAAALEAAIGLGVPVVLVSAPAGAGKTTLVAAARGGVHEMCVWVSLDADDNDPVRFLYALTAALQHVVPTVGAAVSAVLAAHAGSPTTDLATVGRQVVGMLVNDLLRVQPGPLLIVLDDLHVVHEPVVHAVIAYLIERLPPQMTLLLATRHDPPLPLARLRAQRQIAELRLSDLRFTVDETAALLNDQLGLSLDSPDVATLHAYTDGWAAGLILLAASLKQTSTGRARDVLLAQLAEGGPDVFEYLADEVLNRQEPDVRQFLLETSLLADLAPDVCAAITGRTDAPLLLNDLYRRNLFLMRLDARSTRQSPSEHHPRTAATYRYHDLFAAFLRDRLWLEVPERIPDLYVRAAAAEPLPARRVQYLLSAQAWEQAADFIEQIGEQVSFQGAVDTLQGWIAAVPAEVRSRRPRLSYFLGVCAWVQLDMHGAQALFEQALAGFTRSGDTAGQGDALVYLASYHNLRGDFAGAQVAIAGALDCPIPLRSRTQVLQARAVHELAQGHWANAITTMTAALSLAESADDNRALYALVDNSVTLSGPFTAVPGGMAYTERLCDAFAARFPEPVPVHVTVACMRAIILLWRAEWPEAFVAIEVATRLAAQFGNEARAQATAGALLPMCYGLMGDRETSDAGFEQLFRGLTQSAATAYADSWLTGFLSWQGRLDWLQGRLSEAEETYRRMCAMEGPREWPYAPAIRQIFQGSLHLANGDYRAADTAFVAAAHIQEQYRFTTVYSNAYHLLAYSAWLQGRHDDALAVFAPVLAQHEREDVPGMLLWEGATVVTPLLQLAVERGVCARFARHTLTLIQTRGLQY